MVEVKPIKGGMSVLHNPPPGTCQQCAVKHEPEMPHNQQSLAWQYWFYAEAGRWPTWADAMQHCTKEMKSYWAKALGQKGIRITPEDEAAADDTAAFLKTGKESK
jgi:hypothetical protein